MQPLAERMEIVAAFGCVWMVTPFDEPTCDLILELIRPDVHAKRPGCPRLSFESLSAHNLGQRPGRFPARGVEPRSSRLP